MATPRPAPSATSSSTGESSSPSPSSADETSEPREDSLLVRAARGEPGLPHAPVWFMRQAGRSLPEYRALRAELPMLTACQTPDLVVELTLQPVRRHGVDAAVLFSDIVVPLVAAGMEIDIVAGTGPVVAKPVRHRGDAAAVPLLDAEAVGFVEQSVRRLIEELDGLPLIGFAGAPFTLASYLIEGGPSRHHERTKAFMHGDPLAWHTLLDRLAQITVTFLRVQTGAGASAVQLFDSWAGVLSAADYREFVLPHSTKVLAALAATGVPRIHFGVGTGELLGLLGSAGADVVGVDWRVPLDEAARRIGPDKAVQGNLDPAVLFAPADVVEHEVRRVVREGAAAPGHIMNLGHGVLPETDPDMLTRVVELVHAIPLV